MKFKGDGDSFSSKVRIFYDAYLRAEILPIEYILLFILIENSEAIPIKDKYTERKRRETVYNATDYISFDYIVEEREKAKEKFKAKNSSKFKAFKHLIDTAEEATEEDRTAETIITSPRYNSSVFHGIIIDTRAVKVSTVGKGQYEAYKALYKAELLPSRGINVKFDISKATSISMIIIPYMSTSGVRKKGDIGGNLGSRAR
ncbi:uncharacterized protein RAG0_08187 [Rhynchosporium agropyri]|uniref:Uncharacterized protein n=1 Tax=Rhynchosporium agropyri TaxID=914238 RepID=A0A1E1KPH7_9HELO|nr:uncharacterized protein RAG0_08187 [Rhynchosporium agropyri]